MATKPMIDRLSKRIESLAAVHQPMRIAVIFVGVDETKEDAVQRHYRERPDVTGEVFPKPDGALNGEAEPAAGGGARFGPPRGWTPPPLCRSSLATFGKRATAAPGDGI